MVYGVGTLAFIVVGAVIFYFIKVADENKDQISRGDAV